MSQPCHISPTMHNTHISAKFWVTCKIRKVRSYFEKTHVVAYLTLRLASKLFSATSKAHISQALCLARYLWWSQDYFYQASLSFFRQVGRSKIIVPRMKLDLLTSQHRLFQIICRSPAKEKLLIVAKHCQGLTLFQ